MRTIGVMLLVAIPMLCPPVRAQQCVAADDYPDAITVAHGVPTNDTIYGQVEWNGDRDVFSFVAQPYITYEVSMEPLSAGLSDVEVRVFDPLTNLVMRVTSTGGRTNASAGRNSGSKLDDVMIQIWDARLKAV